MGGYSYLAMVTKRPKPAAGERAGDELWRWLVAKLDDLAHDELGHAIADYARDSVGTIRVEDGGVAIHFGDAGGVGWYSCQATVHALAILAERHIDEVRSLFARHELVAAEPLSTDHKIAARNFFWFDGGVASIESEIVGRDSNGTDDGAEWALDPATTKRTHELTVPGIGTLSPANRKRLRAFLKADRCECPACAETPAR